jgi:hypothetical protein
MKIQHWMQLHRDSEVRILKLKYTMQQNASVQFYRLYVYGVYSASNRNEYQKQKNNVSWE